MRTVTLKGVDVSASIATTVLSTVLPGMLRRRPTLSVSDSEKRQRENIRVLILGSDLPRANPPNEHSLETIKNQ